MNISNTPPSRVYKLHVFLRVPGQHLDVLDGARLTQSVVKPIEFALASAHLLATSEPPRQTKDLACKAAAAMGELMQAIQDKRSTVAELRKLLSLPGKDDAKMDEDIEELGTVTWDTLDGLHGGRAIAGVAFDDWCLFLIEVTDLTRAGQILFRELEGMNLLTWCEVAVFDPALNALRTVFPLACEKRFERHWELLQRVSADGLAKAAQSIKNLREGTGTK
jgi:hypothetical protein